MAEDQHLEEVESLKRYHDMRQGADVMTVDNFYATGYYSAFREDKEWYRNFIETGKYPNKLREAWELGCKDGEGDRERLTEG